MNQSSDEALPPTRSSRPGMFFLLVIPVFGVALSTLFLGEQVQVWQLASIAAILTGITIANIKTRH